MVLNIFRTLLKFLNGNSGAIAAVATTVGVIIAALYTFYTTRLWKVSVQQARSAELQAESAQRQLRLMEQQMAASERTFEAVHRPHLLINAQVVDGPDLGTERTVRLLTILAKNYGATAATVISAKCNVPKGEGAVWLPLLLPIVIPPGETEGLGRAVLPSTPDDEVILSFEGIEKLMRWFHVYILYKGLSESEYQTRAQILLCLM